MDTRPELESRLVELGRARNEASGSAGRRQGIKARLFGELTPPQRIGRFVDLGLLGDGAMGTVRRAYDERLAREVAIKLVRHRSPRHDDRLMREAQALAQLSHPNVVQIYEVGEAQGEIFIAMELVDGVALDEWQRRPRPWRECLETYVQAGRGLAAAHEAGLIHRDFKPSNCIRDSRGRVRVLDFGLARAAALDEPPEGIPPVSVATTESTAPMLDGSGGSTQGSDTMLYARLTADDAVVGTIAFMAPEQFAGRRTDAKSDQFAFCVSLYQALYGALPFGKDPRRTLVGMLGGQTPRPEFPTTQNTVPKGLRRALQRGLAGDPEARWPSMEALLGELERLRRRSAWRRVTLTGMVGGVSALLAAPLMSPSAADDACRRDLETFAAGAIGVSDVEGAFAASGLPHADEVWSKVRPALREYGSRWDSEYLALCGATSGFAMESPRQSARRRCLERRRFALEGALEVLSDVDEQIIDDAPELVSLLPPIDDCDDLDEPTSPTLLPPPPPEDPRVERIARGIERARVLDHAGRFEAGSLAANEATTVAEELGYEPLLAEALLAKGRLLASSGHPEEAEAVLEHAARLSSDVRLQAVSLRAQVTGIELGRSDVGLALLNTALAFSPEASPRARALAQTTLGNIMLVRGEVEQAQGAFEGALELLQTELGEEHLLLVDPLGGLARAYVQRHELEAARATYERIAGILRERAGGRHPETDSSVLIEAALASADLGVAHYHEGEHDRALASLEGALATMSRAPEPNRVVLAEIHGNLGAVHQARGDLAEAKRELLEAIGLWTSVYGSSHRLVGTVQLNLANVLRKQESLDSAAERYSIATRILEGLESTPKNAETLAQAYRDLGRLRHQQHDLEAAEASCRAGLTRLERAGSEIHPMAASLHNHLGHVLRDRGDLAGGEGHYRRALALYQVLDEPTKAARTRVHLGRVLRAQGEPDEARALAAQARDAFEERGDEKNLAMAQALLDGLDAPG